MKIQLAGKFETREVWLNGKQLSPAKSQKIINHSPDGFNWGYGGSGPAQLALAVCLELFGVKGGHHYQQFKWDIICKLPQTDFDQLIDLSEFISKHPKVKP